MMRMAPYSKMPGFSVASLMAGGKVGLAGATARRIIGRETAACGQLAFVTAAGRYCSPSKPWFTIALISGEVRACS
jgi:hypothetical protein